MASRVRASSSGTESDFEAFYAAWLVDGQRLLDRLIRLSTQNDDVTEEERLIEQVLSHYKSYYEEKVKSMALFFSLPWLTNLEQQLFWTGGFRPSMALSLMEVAVVDLSLEQKGKVVALREEVEAEEKAVEDRGITGEEEAMRAVLRMADGVRRETVVKAVEILSVRQRVKFFVAVGSYHLGMRSLGINFPL